MATLLPDNESSSFDVLFNRSFRAVSNSCILWFAPWVDSSMLLYLEENYDDVAQYFEDVHL